MTKSNSVAPPFTLERRPLDLHFRSVRLAAREWLAPNYVRIRLAGDELDGFDSPGCDDHIRLFFPGGETSSVEELRAAPSREYTPLAWGDGWLDLEFVLHGDAAVGAHWAANAPVGTPAGVGGPRGSVVLNGAPDAWLLAGDETAVPAIRRFAALIPDGAPANVLVEVADAAHEMAIDAPVEYVHRDGESGGVALAARLDGIGTDARPAGSVFGFVAAEQAVVKPGRALLVDRWGLDPEQITVKGYWKRDDVEYHAPH